MSDTDPARPAKQLAPRLYQQARDALAHDITSGALPDGTFLTQLGLAERFGISRAPARMALQELTEAGLIERVGSRYKVRGGSATAPLGVLPETRLTPRSSWEMLYPDIELAIVSRTSLASWRVNEAEMARHHGVSRTVARDVMGRLQQRGIIRKDDNSRWIAPALTAANVDELFELRWLLEPAAMEKAVPKLPAGFLQQMQADLHRAMARDASIDAAVLDRLEQQLHVDLLGHCGNEALMRAISLPQALLVAHHFLYQWTLELFGTEPFLGEHLEIVNHLLAGDVAAAKAALVAHLRISRRRAMLRIEAVQDMIQPEPLPYLERL
ncbi:GntR family transcriptional regulator [Paracoccus shanxieyensis]|uniref:GntR family transcriptional regulator n=1 Tax=Paracoccus shanxieyensis TaxID=2675752 RepID=A0A6L6IY02_9RHOB|nr:GntR family transcriptional regulator [Paracoccus shanxieyensis]MTH64481.1 GntR family transcriptional regulator [Paracoccus shanxieyensis]MTH87526.1 GntR family transcriptional regulator [Paracoccus shanxieyensis]